MVFHAIISINGNVGQLSNKSLVCYLLVRTFSLSWTFLYSFSVQNFMNQSVEKEDTPYIEIDDTYWPPYIELLLRCGVLQRHEQNSNLLRLTPFHFKF